MVHNTDWDESLIFLINVFFRKFFFVGDRGMKKIILHALKITFSLSSQFSNESVTSLLQ